MSRDDLIKRMLSAFNTGDSSFGADDVEAWLAIHRVTSGKDLSVKHKHSRIALVPPLPGDLTAWQRLRFVPQIITQKTTNNEQTQTNRQTKTSKQPYTNIIPSSVIKSAYQICFASRYDAQQGPEETEDGHGESTLWAGLEQSRQVVEEERVA